MRKEPDLEKMTAEEFKGRLEELLRKYEREREVAHEKAQAKPPRKAKETLQSLETRKRELGERFLCQNSEALIKHVIKEKAAIVEKEHLDPDAFKKIHGDLKSIVKSGDPGTRR